MSEFENLPTFRIQRSINGKLKVYTVKAPNLGAAKLKADEAAANERNPPKPKRRKQ